MDEKIIEKANKIRECEEKKFRMSNIISDHETLEKLKGVWKKKFLFLLNLNKGFSYLINCYLCQGRKKRLIHLLEK